MHDSVDGQSVTFGTGGSALLVAESASDICLSCHAEDQGSVLGSDVLAPPLEKGGGNFVFLLEDNLNDAADGASNPISGDRAGHNLNAPAYGLTTDAFYSTSPGGSFPASELGCTSCHDPHGNQNFRMLYGQDDIQGGIYQFTSVAPDAEGIALTGPPESSSHHTAYRADMSEW